MCWNPVRLQLRGLNCLPRLCRSPRAMETILALCLTWRKTSRTSSLTPPTRAFLTGWTPASCTPLWVEEGCWALWVAQARTQRPNTTTCLSSSALAPLHPPPQPPATPVTRPPWGMMGGLSGKPVTQGLGGPQQQQPGMMPQPGMVAGLNRGMMGTQKGNGQPQSMMGGQMMNGAPRMGYTNVNMNAGMVGNGNMLPDALQQQNAGQQMAQAAMRPQQPGAVNKAARQFCPHHVGHYLGMDVHDTPELSRSQPLQPGMVITIEPGLYISEDDSSCPEPFRGLGVRIEDDVVIREHGGPLILSANTPKTIAEVESACAHGED